MTYDLCVISYIKNCSSFLLFIQVSETAEEQKEGTSAEELGGHPIVVLVADDPEQGRLFCYYTPLGAELHIVGSVDEAIRTVHSCGHIDYFVSDHQLPDGIALDILNNELCRGVLGRARRAVWSAEIPIVVASLYRREYGTLLLDKMRVRESLENFFANE